MRRAIISILAAVVFPTVSAAQDTAVTQNTSEGTATVVREKVRPVASLKGGHPSFRLGPLRLDVHGRVQADIRRSDGNSKDAGDLDLARKRLGVEGQIGRTISFEVDGEVADHNPWRDALLEYRAHSALRIRAGQFKLPLGMETTTSSTELDFASRSQAAIRLAPGRDRGVMLHGRLWRRRLIYEAGTFVHDGDNLPRKGLDRTSGGPTTAIRLSSIPFHSRTLLSELQVGAAFAESRVEEGVSGLNGRTVPGESFFAPVYWVRGTRTRTGVETRWQPGSFSLAAEYLRLSDERRGQSLTGGDLSPLVASGWYVSSTWLITGESKSPQVRPRRPVQKGGIGAIELATRLESLRLGDLTVAAPGFPNPRADSVPGSRDRGLTAGLNWYLNRSVKAQVNIIREVLQGTPTVPRGILSYVARLQFTL